MLNRRYNVLTEDGLAALLAEPGIDPGLSSAWAEFGEDCQRFFPSPDWYHVAGMGVTEYRTTPDSPPAVSHLSDLLRITAMLRSLQRCVGFGRLLAKLLDSGSFESTIYEIEVGCQLLSHSRTDELEIEPIVETRSGPKRPDYGWKLRGFSLPLYVECKRYSPRHLSISAEATKLGRRLEKEYSALDPWPSGWRVDVVLKNGIHNGSPERCEALMRALHVRVGKEGPREVSLLDNEVQVSFVPRSKDRQIIRPGVQSLYLKAGPTPTRVGTENAYLLLYVSFARQVRSVVRRQIEDACKQFSPEATGIVALSAPHLADVEQTVNQLLARSSLSNLAGVLVFSEDGGHLITGTRPRIAALSDY